MFRTRLGAWAAGLSLVVGVTLTPPVATVSASADAGTERSTSTATESTAPSARTTGDAGAHRGDGALFERHEARAQGTGRENLRNGEAAIKQLGQRIDEVAAEHGTTGSELAEELREDSSLHVDSANHLLYLDRAGATATAVEEGAPFPLSETYSLHSDPGADRIIYLDFDGGSYRPGDPPLSRIIDEPVSIPPFEGSQAAIQRIWQRVAEDFAPFAVDVTTEEPLLTDLVGCGDRCGARISIGGSPQDAGFPAGVAGVASFGLTFGVVAEPTAFVFPAVISGNDLAVGAVTSHETGHTFGLVHDGTASLEYYSGHGIGATSWCPLMGLCVNRPLSQWSQGEYPRANNQEDDVAVIAAQAPLRPDDVPGTAQLSGQPLAVDQPGLIGARGDTDEFAFTSGAGPASFAVVGAPRGPNLDTSLQLLGSAGTVVAQVDDPQGLHAMLNIELPAGEYVLRVDGVGDQDPLPGYSDYGSLGRYHITGSYPPNLAPDCSTVTADPATLWPPDQKLHAITLAGATDPEGDSTALTVTTVTQDEPLTSSFDAQPGTAADEVQLRAARAGNGDGRVYTITYEARDPQGMTCTGTVIVSVPQSRKSTAIDSGQTLDSFG